MKVSNNSKYQTHKKLLNSRETEKTELAHQIPASAGPGVLERGHFRNF